MPPQIVSSSLVLTPTAAGTAARVCRRGKSATAQKKTRPATPHAWLLPHFWPIFAALR
jgi:hypothetical protein